MHEANLLDWLHGVGSPSDVDNVDTLGFTDAFRRWRLCVSHRDIMESALSNVMHSVPFT